MQKPAKSPSLARRTRGAPIDAYDPPPLGLPPDFTLPRSPFHSGDPRRRDRASGTVLNHFPACHVERTNGMFEYGRKSDCLQ